MNIREAKQQIKNTMRAYFAKDEYGNFLLPVEEQRPIFLIGPPGIGKTAIVAEVASELGVGMLSYSMTHHTRQSALGLPMIETKIYDGREYKVTEYTMSEIIASIYDLMEDSGVKEGILFLDEIDPLTGEILIYPTVHNRTEFLSMLETEKSNGSGFDIRNVRIVFDENGEVALITRFYVPWQ